MKDITSMTPEEIMEMAIKGIKIKEREKKHSDRNRAKRNILVAKAEKAGLTASEVEIQAELKQMAKRSRK